MTTNLRGRVVALERRQPPRRIDCTREERDEREVRAAYEAAFARVIEAVGGEELQNARPVSGHCLNHVPPNWPSR